MARKKTVTNAESVMQVDSLDKIDRIRDLIIGPHVRDFTQRFSTITKDLERLEGELTRLTSELKEQGKQAQTNLQQLEQRLTTQLNEQDTRASDQIGKLDQQMTERTQDIEQRFTNRIQELLKDLRDLELSARSELRQTVGEMDEAKMDRFSLGELFTQLGEGLKTSSPEDEVTTLLDQLQQELK